MRALAVSRPEGLAPIIVEQLATTIKQLGQGLGMALVLVEQHVDFAPRCVRIDRARTRVRCPSVALAQDRERLQCLIRVATSGLARAQHNC
jgi:ABC-type branched-subunit amino acid transport system ATPase component